ncbi:MAG: zinc dependent phospholipase C family protein [Clostridiales bacterium]|nr:zinc dependent phospholipase C family protein [Clostridiales bacterium]
MPAAYAHYSFGKEVLKHLSGELTRIIEKHRELYNIGLHGPDILFYFKPFGSNHVNRTGHEIHKKTADVFFDRAKEILLECSDPDAACAYLAGFICHFMLDSECHPDVRKMEAKGYLHSTIETEFERFLLSRDHLDPLSTCVTNHIIPDDEYAKCICRFFDGITDQEVVASLCSMKFYLNLLVAPGIIKRTMVIAALKLSGNPEKIGLLMRYRPIPACADYCKTLIEQYTNAILPTAKLINEFYENRYIAKPLNPRFQRTFG